MTSVEKWIKKQSKFILQEIGIREGDIVLDFGCGSGVYTIIASKIVGQKGKVYALDSDQQELEEVMDKAESEDLGNIEFLKTPGEINIPLDDESVDIMLVYDVIHLLSEYEREKLIKEGYRILKKGGFLSYHATHINSYDINLEEMHSKMEKNNLILREKIEKPMFHWAWIEDSVIFNYLKI
ncbi:MAG: methyltransferase domain-containing protein [Promethearchaeota archaeon]|nr:MAG: methyltransferase domain-containing protein [Candidatus Lokiarchaeota archaeon]